MRVEVPELDASRGRALPTDVTALQSQLLAKSTVSAMTFRNFSENDRLGPDRLPSPARLLPAHTSRAINTPSIARAAIVRFTHCAPARDPRPLFDHAAGLERMEAGNHAPARPCP
jgi:hypothetical protein